MRVFASWSGGKDCCFACYEASKFGLEVVCLLNMVSEDGARSSSHGVEARLMAAQAEAMGIPILQCPSTFDGYEQVFKRAIQALKHEGIEGGVFGDIDVEEHREWVERVCTESGISAHLPLWGQPQEQVLAGFVAAGFDAVVVTTKAEFLGEEWLGRKVDASFLEDISKLDVQITACGELGEYHSLVVDGPTFRSSLRILESGKVYRNGYWHLEIPLYELAAKG